MSKREPCNGDNTSPHGWTLDTLEEHLSAKIKSLAELTAMENKASKEAVNAALIAVKVQYDAAMASSSKAIDKADIATEKRFDSVNEFRKTLSDQAGNLLGRAEYDANHKSLTDKIIALTSRFDTWEGKSKGIGEGWGIIVAAGGLATGILIAVASFIR